VETDATAAPEPTGTEDHGWRHDAACLSEDPELFFPEGESDRYQPQVSAALEVCGSCAVAEDCLRYALEADQRTGIWGGTTAQMRHDLELVGGRVRTIGAPTSAEVAVHSVAS